MSAAGKFLRRWEGGGRAGYHLFCPGCESPHMVTTEGPSTWGFNGDLERPTFTPSILVTYNGSDAGVGDAPPAVCHSFVRDGQIQFLGDCTHALAGQTVALPPYSERWT